MAPIPGGQKVPVGSILIVEAESEEVLWNLIRQDPFYKRNVVRAIPRPL